MTKETRTARFKKEQAARSALQLERENREADRRFKRDKKQITRDMNATTRKARIAKSRKLNVKAIVGINIHSDKKLTLPWVKEKKG